MCIQFAAAEFHAHLIQLKVYFMLQPFDSMQIWSERKQGEGELNLQLYKLSNITFGMNLYLFFLVNYLFRGKKASFFLGLAKSYRRISAVYHYHIVPISR